MRRLAICVATMLALSLTVVVAPPATAATCNGSEITGTGSIIVPSGVTCTLTETTVEGSIFVQPNANLSLDGVLVKGSVSASQPRDVDIVNSYMRGLTINGSQGQDVTFIFCNNFIAGNVAINTVTNEVVFGDNGSFCPAGLGNTVCGVAAFRFITRRLHIENNTFTGAGSINYDAQVELLNNRFGGALSTARSTLTANEGNVSADPEVASVFCPEELPSPPPGEEEER